MCKKELKLKSLTGYQFTGSRRRSECVVLVGYLQSHNGRANSKMASASIMCISHNASATFVNTAASAPSPSSLVGRCTNLPGFTTHS